MPQAPGHYEDSSDDEDGHELLGLTAEDSKSGTDTATAAKQLPSADSATLRGGPDRDSEVSYSKSLLQLMVRALDALRWQSSIIKHIRHFVVYIIAHLNI